MLWACDMQTKFICIAMYACAYNYGAGTGISIVSHPAVQAMRCMMYRIRQSLSYMYNLASCMLHGTINGMVNFKQLYPFCSNSSTN